MGLLASRMSLLNKRKKVFTIYLTNDLINDILIMNNLGGEKWDYLIL